MTFLKALAVVWALALTTVFVGFVILWGLIHL